jgi:hypothetical protein
MDTRQGYIVFHFYILTLLDGPSTMEIKHITYSTLTVSLKGLTVLAHLHGNYFSLDETSPLCSS